MPLNELILFKGYHWSGWLVNWSGWSIGYRLGYFYTTWDDTHPVHKYS